MIFLLNYGIIIIVNEKRKKKIFRRNLNESIYNNAKELYFKYASKQKDKIKTILNLTFYGYTQSEIAEIIGTTRSYVQKTLRDHRVKLRKLILENETLKSKAF